VSANGGMRPLSKKLNNAAGTEQVYKMPGITNRDAKMGKGRVRAQGRIDKVMATILKNPDSMDPDSSFGVITKVIGNSGMLIRLSDMTDVKGKVYSKVLKTGRCWKPGTIVITSPGIRHGEYEINAMVERSDAKRGDLVPPWMIAIAEGAAVEEALAAADMPFEFEGDAKDDDESLDIDNI
jgi:hypothetical protein